MPRSLALAVLLALLALPAAGLASESPSENEVVEAVRGFVKSYPNASVVVHAAAGHNVSFEHGTFYVRRGVHGERVRHPSRAMPPPKEPITADAIQKAPLGPHLLLGAVARLLSMVGGASIKVVIPGRGTGGIDDLTVVGNRRQKFDVLTLSRGQEQPIHLRRYFFQPGDATTDPVFVKGTMTRYDHHKYGGVDYAITETTSSILKNGMESLHRVEIVDLLGKTPFSGEPVRRWTKQGVSDTDSRIKGQKTVWRKVLLTPEEKHRLKDQKKRPPRITELQTELGERAAKAIEGKRREAPAENVIEALITLVALLDPVGDEAIHLSNVQEGLHYRNGRLEKHYVAGLAHAGGRPTIAVEGYQRFTWTYPINRTTKPISEEVPVSLSRTHLEKARTDAMAKLLALVGPWGEIEVVANRHRKNHQKPRQIASGKWTSPENVQIVLGNLAEHKKLARSRKPSKISAFEYGTDLQDPLPLRSYVDRVAPSYHLPHKIRVERILSPSATQKPWLGTSIELAHRDHHGRITYHGTLQFGKDEIIYYLQTGKEIRIPMAKLSGIQKQQVWNALVWLRSGKFKKGVIRTLRTIARASGKSGSGRLR